MYTIGQFAKKTGLTIRTLRYYDEKGLVKPASLTEGGQRLYNDDNISTVQKIVIYKYLDFSIEEIKTLLQEDQPLLQSMQQQKKLLEQKKIQLEKVISSIDTVMAIHEKIDEVDPTLLLLVMHSLLTEQQQKEYLQQYLPQAVIDDLYHMYDRDFVEINRQYIERSYALKEAYRQQLSDREMTELLQRFLNIIPVDLQQKIVEHCADVNIESLDEWLFPSPFTKEEEEWVVEQMTRLNILEGN